MAVVVISAFLLPPGTCPCPPAVCCVAVGTTVVTAASLDTIIVPPAAAVTIAAVATAIVAAAAVSVAAPAGTVGVAVAAVATAIAASAAISVATPAGTVGIAGGVAFSLAWCRKENGAINDCKAETIADMVVIIDCLKKVRLQHNNSWYVS